jgi:hypothetical protein
MHSIAPGFDAKARAAAVRASRRRRAASPATSFMKVYTPEEVELLRAVDEYRRVKRRPFPSAIEVLAIIRSLGYRRPGAG